MNLQTDYKQNRLVFARNMKQLINKDGIDVKQIFFCDEVNFDLYGHVNKQNYCFWAPENPHVTEIKELKPRHVNAWYVVFAIQIFGPVFIKENLTGDVYQNLLKSEFLPCGGKKIIFRRIFGLWKMGFFIIAQNQIFFCKIRRSIGEFSVLATH